MPQGVGDIIKIEGHGQSSSEVVRSWRERWDTFDYLKSERCLVYALEQRPTDLMTLFYTLEVIVRGNKSDVHMLPTLRPEYFGRDD